VATVHLICVDGNRESRAPAELPRRTLHMVCGKTKYGQYMSDQYALVSGRRAAKQ